MESVTRRGSWRQRDVDASASGDQQRAQRRQRGELLLDQQQIRRGDDQRVAQEQEGAQLVRWLHARLAEQNADRSGRRRPILA